MKRQTPFVAFVKKCNAVIEYCDETLKVLSGMK